MSQLCCSFILILSALVACAASLLHCKVGEDSVDPWSCVISSVRAFVAAARLTMHSQAITEQHVECCLASVLRQPSPVITSFRVGRTVTFESFCPIFPAVLLAKAFACAHLLWAHLVLKQHLTVSFQITEQMISYLQWLGPKFCVCI